MATTVHIPAAVLKSVDDHARKQKISRNKYITQALVAQLEADQAAARWPESLFADMKRWRSDPGRVEAVREVTRIIASSRRSKKPIAL